MPWSEMNKRLSNAAAAGDNDTIIELLDHGADLRSSNGNALSVAAMCGRKETVKLLLDRGADIHVGYDAPLCLGAYHGHKETVEFLLNRGADIHAGNDLSLRRSADNGHKETALLLLRHGADQHVKCNDDEKPLKGAHKLAQWLSELEREVPNYFKSKTLSQEQCFTAGKLDDNVLDACVTGQFATLIGAPLIASTDKADRRLFQDIWDALPSHWQDQNQDIYMQFIKEGGLNPIVGPHTSATQRDSESPGLRIGK